MAAAALTERHAANLHGVLSCFDRIIITGTPPGACYAGDMTSFLYAHGIRIFAVIDLEDLSSGVSIADLTLADYRIELAGYLREHPGRLHALPLGAYAVTAPFRRSRQLRPRCHLLPQGRGPRCACRHRAGYPLAPHYVVHVGADGAVLLPHSQAKQVLDRLNGLCLGRNLADAQACERFDKATASGRQMQPYQAMLQQAVASIVGKTQERAVASPFSPGGTHTGKSGFAGAADFEVVAFLVINEA